MDKLRRAVLLSCFAVFGACGTADTPTGAGGSAGQGGRGGSGVVDDGGPMGDGAWDGRGGVSGSGGIAGATGGGMGGASGTRDGPAGIDTYALIDSVLGANAVEHNPDADHTPTFLHVKEESDSEVGNHFVFYAHYPIDNDGAPDDDRSRIEIKVNGGAPSALKGTPGKDLYVAIQNERRHGFFRAIHPHVPDEIVRRQRRSPHHYPYGQRHGRR